MLAVGGGMGCPTNRSLLATTASFPGSLRGDPKRIVLEVVVEWR
jgi:hypothetical protein